MQISARFLHIFLQEQVYEPRYGIPFPFSLPDAYVIGKALNIFRDNHFIKISMNNLMRKDMLHPHKQRTDKRTN